MTFKPKYHDPKTGETRDTKEPKKELKKAPTETKGK